MSESLAESGVAPSAGRGRAAAPGPARTGALWLALLAGPLSFGIAGPALVLDDVAAALGVRTGAATWAVTAFGWGIAVGTPLLAGLLGRRGLRAALTVCGLLVAAGAVLAATVPVLPAVVLGTALQGLGTAGLTATAMSLAVTPLRMGCVTASLAVVGSTAPLVGSLVNDVFSWRATLALPVLSLLALPAVLRGAPPDTVARDRFDAAGAVLMTALVTALVFVPHQPPAAGVCAVAAAVLLGLHLRARPDGFVPAVLVRTPAFLFSAGTAFALAVVNFGLMYAIPERLSEHTDWTSSQIGVAMVWPLLLGGTLSWFVVAASARVGRVPVAAVLAAMGVAGAVTAWLATAPPVLLVAQGLASIAAASGQGVLAVHATSAVPDGHRPAAIGLFNLCYLLGAAFGPAVVGLLAL
ncbi:MFS transporter [Streptomyces sp. TRM 70361]|uniref:MFS transporter n=1 Tax=Streptomyces sp. TRM 70361 TaxID=3116553 RepID=UPI002E7B8957|nr:MFS transporter [Streptomyces sp. TRM 70361]MEE1940150.1 MFS transporter [Streptomyces sp. TRM 70361]